MSIPRVHRRTPFYRHQVDPSTALRFEEVLRSEILTSGEVGRAVEAQLCDFFAAKSALLVNSWTNGAVATLLAMDIGRGDEVIVPAMTFIATANCVELVGATPVFVDVEPGNRLISIEQVVGRLGPHTKAVIPVHLYGQMVDVPALRQALDRAGHPHVRIIEDAAHCFEGSRSGDLPGSASDCAIFSFYATKNVTCGEGGAIVSNDAELMERIKKTRLHGMSVGAADRFKSSSYRHWDMECLGTKANLPDVLACMLPAQIDTIRTRLAERARLYSQYAAALAGSPFELPDIDAGVIHAHHLLAVGTPAGAREATIEQLNAAGIGVAVNYRAVPNLSYYQRKYGFARGTFPNAEDWGERTISLPFYPGMPEEDLRHVLDTLLSDRLQGARSHAA
jgi:UDP-4-amino-4-deoxy-L-arabinose-oxoglutarate aminotransferase